MNDIVKIIVGPRYGAYLWDLRKQVYLSRKNKTPLIILKIEAVAVSGAIEVAIESDSLYLIGVRKSGGQWYEFADDRGVENSNLIHHSPKRLPGSKHIPAGSGIALSTYRGLRLQAMLEFSSKSRSTFGYTGLPNNLIDYFCGWNGRLDLRDDRVAMCALIFLLCEALRFRSIENVCTDWINRRGPSGPSLTLVIDDAMMKTVQSWKERSAAQDPDVWTRHPDFPDHLIS